MANISKNIKVQFEFLCAVIRYVRIDICIFQCLKFDALSFVVKTSIWTNASDKLNTSFHQRFHQISCAQILCQTRGSVFGHSVGGFKLLDELATKLLNKHIMARVDHLVKSVFFVDFPIDRNSAFAKWHSNNNNPVVSENIILIYKQGAGHTPCFVI